MSYLALVDHLLQPLEPLGDGSHVVVGACVFVLAFGACAVCLRLGVGTGNNALQRAAFMDANFG